MPDFSHLPYRPCVGVMLVNRAGLAFVGRRIDTKEGDFWQMPQGGVDPGEDIDAAGLRELAEETGVRPHRVELIGRTQDDLLYDLPPELLGKIWKGRYRGQRQTWLLARFLGEDADIRLDAHEPAEFEAWKWIAPELLPELIVPFKRAVYEAVLAEFRPLL